MDKEQLLKVAEVKLIYVNKVKASERPKISSSRDAYLILKQFYEDDMIEHYEKFYVMYLNRGNKVLGVREISKGGVSGTVADPKIIFQGAILSNCSGVIFCHNHPSGNLKASQSDMDLTRKLKECGKLHEIEVMDHVILAPDDKYFSFADEGIL